LPKGASRTISAGAGRKALALEQEDRMTSGAPVVAAAQRPARRAFLWLHCT